MSPPPATFDPSAYGPVVAALLADSPLPPLGPGEPHAKFRDRLSQLTPTAIFAGRQPSDEAMARCCLSGLWLWHNFLDQSHTLSQDIETVEGSYWHGIMHRREPDYGNAKYWFRRIGKHAILPAIAAGAAAIAAESSGRSANDLVPIGKWDPYQFIDRCEAIAQGAEGEQEARRIAALEWQLLFDHCYRATIET